MSSTLSYLAPPVIDGALGVAPPAPHRARSAPPIEIAARGQRVRILLRERAWPHSTDAYDRDAVSATVIVDVGTMRAEMHTIIWSHELDALHHRLSHVSEHHGSTNPLQWATLDGLLCLTMMQTADAQVQVVVDAWDPDRHTQMHANIAADGQQLRMWIDLIARALQSFPSPVA